MCRSSWLVLSCLLVACPPADPVSEDAGRMVDAAEAPDAPAESDAAPDDAFRADFDAASRDGWNGSDALHHDALHHDALHHDALHHDASVASDAPSLHEPGECDPTACTPTCFRMISCVKVCGGPATACGCCACATGSFDAIECP